MFCRLLQCFYLKLWDLYLKKSSVHLSVFSSLHLQSVSQGQSPVEAAELLAQAQHRDSQSRFQVGSKYLQEQRLPGILRNLLQCLRTFTLKISPHI